MTIRVNKERVTGNGCFIGRDELILALMTLYKAHDFSSYGNLLVMLDRLDAEIERYRKNRLVCAYLRIKRHLLAVKANKIATARHEAQARYLNIYRALPLDAYVHKSCLWTIIDDLITGRAKDLEEAKELWKKRVDTDLRWYCNEI